eukprot:2615862-Rhodomonas_salina.1
MLEPVAYQGRRTITFPISKPVLSKKQLALGLEDKYAWWIRKLLDDNFSKPKTLEDCCLSQTTVEKVQQTVLNIWCRLPIDAVLHSPSESDTNSGESGGCSPTGEPSDHVGPFKDLQENEVWLVLASQMAEGYKALADIDMLEPNPANRNEAMQNSRLRPFWITLEIKEMDGLDKLG